MPKKLNLHPMQKGFGWKRPALPDFTSPKMVPHFAGPLPTHVDMRDKCAPVYDQSTLGSCTAQAWAAAVEFVMQKNGKTPYIPSRLFIYYNERVLEGTVSEDSGASLADGAKVLRKQGAPHESMWAYDIAKFAKKPTRTVYADGLKHLVMGTARVRQKEEDFKKVLASGLPIVGGFAVMSSFVSEAVSKTGMGVMPTPDEEMLGGHAIMVVGYCDEKRQWIVRNSWGEGWGDKGYFYMPYEYFLDPDLADDFWCCASVN